VKGTAWLVGKAVYCSLVGPTVDCSEQHELLVVTGRAPGHKCSSAVGRNSHQPTVRPSSDNRLGTGLLSLHHSPAVVQRWSWL